MLAPLLLFLLLQGPRDLKVPEEAVLKPPVIVPAGTIIPVELVNRFSTKDIKEGDNIYARTIMPIAVNNQIAIPVGTSVHGKITSVERPGRVKGKASLALSFQTLIFPNGYTLPIYGSLGGSDTGTRVGESRVEGDSTKGEDIGKVASAGAPGAILGGILGGGKGAAIGGGVGASVALAGVLLSRGGDLELPRGTILEVVLDEAVEP